MIKPLDNYVVLQEIIKDTTAGGIWVSDKNIDRPNIAMVVVCGPDVKRVEVGQKVLFKYHLFDEVNLSEDLSKEDKYLVGEDKGIIALC